MVSQILKEKITVTLVIFNNGGAHKRSSKKTLLQKKKKKDFSHFLVCADIEAFKKS